MGLASRASATLVALGVAGHATAQQENWISSLLPAEGSYFGSAHTVPHGPLWFSCNGSRDGTPVADGYADLQPPYTLTLELRHDALGRADGPITRGGLRIGVDQTIYQMPAMRFSPDKQWISWSVHLSMSDPLFADIMDGGTVTVYAGEVLLSRHEGAIAQNVTDTIGFCIEEHLRTGVPVPPHAQAAVAQMQGGVPSGPTAPTTDRRMRDHVAAICGAPAQIDGDRVFTTEVNGDGRPDTILFWGGVTCLGGPNAETFAAGKCGASFCLTSIFVSGTGRGSLPDDEFLSGEGPVFDPARPQLLGIGLPQSACLESGLMPTCLAWFRWTGADFQRVN